MTQSRKPFTLFYSFMHQKNLPLVGLEPTNNCTEVEFIQHAQVCSRSKDVPSSKKSLFLMKLNFSQSETMLGFKVKEWASRTTPYLTNFVLPNKKDAFCIKTKNLFRIQTFNIPCCKPTLQPLTQRIDFLMQFLEIEIV